MKIVSEESTVVIVGDWNNAIFKPAWISGRLTEAPDIEVQLAVSNPGQPPRLGFDNLFLRVFPDRLILSPQGNQPEALAKMETVSLQILGDLGHTPVRAVGVNFNFLEESSPESLLNAFLLKDRDNLSDQGVTVESTVIKRTLSIEGYTLNLSLEKDSGSEQVALGLNFHQAVLGATEAVTFLRNCTEKMRSLAEDLLDKSYGLRVE